VLRQLLIHKLVLLLIDRSTWRTLWCS
jgi:hypothetical protein